MIQGNIVLGAVFLGLRRRAASDKQNSHHFWKVLQIGNWSPRFGAYSSASSLFFVTIIFKKYQWTLTNLEWDEFSDVLHPTLPETKMMWRGKSTHWQWQSWGFDS